MGLHLLPAKQKRLLMLLLDFYDVFIYYAVFTTKKDTVFFLSNQLLWYTFFIFIADVKSCCCFAETSVKIYDIFWEEPSAILHFSGRKTLCFPHTALFRQEKWHDTS